MSKHLVSVLIPVFNAEEYIEKAIISILNQSYPLLEVIIVNDGSTDGTRMKLEAIQDERLKIFHQENKGQCASSNRAFRESRGDLIKFFDADDILNPENIELQVERIAEDFDYVASSEWGRFYNDDLSTFHLNPEKVWKDMAPVEWLVQSWSNGLNMMQCAIWLIPRKILNVSGLWNERLTLNNDIDFFTRVLLSSKGVKFTAGARLYYRSGTKGSLSNTTNRTAMEAALLSNRLAVSNLLEVENSLRTRLACANVLQVWVYNTYPEFPDLTSQLEFEIAQLGGAKYKLPGGSFLRFLSQVLGWKRAKKIHAFLSRLKTRTQ